MTTEVYIVTSGSYSDYSIDSVFLDKGAAERYVETVNARSRYADADIEVFQVTPADWRSQEVTEFWSWLAASTAYVVKAHDITRPEITSGAAREWAETEVKESGPTIRVFTKGTTAMARQAHSDAVGQARAEILGIA